MAEGVLSDILAKEGWFSEDDSEEVAVLAHHQHIQVWLMVVVLVLRCKLQSRLHLIEVAIELNALVVRLENC